MMDLVRQSVLGDLFKAGTDLANLGLLGLLGTIVVLLAWAVYRVTRTAYDREVQRADIAMAGWNNATTQFERALNLIDKMQNRRRSEDAS